MTNDELERNINSVFGDHVTLTKELALKLVNRLRATEAERSKCPAHVSALEALVERAFAEGFAAGVDAREWHDFDSAMDREAGKWRRSDAKAALDRLRGDVCQHEWRTYTLTTGDGIPVELRTCEKCHAHENRVLPYQMPESDALREGR